MQTTPPKKASQPEDWTGPTIIAALHNKGITLMGLARAHNLKDSSGLSVALARSFPLGEKRIADAIGVNPMVIWPSRYNADGSRKLQGFRAVQFNATENARNSKRTAADSSMKKAA